MYPTLTFTSSYFIQDGAVLESGTHDQLIAHRGAYYEYVQLQTLSKV
jgi:ATP-binding cassette subfamily B (MDR/TAP) protein 1